MLAWSPLLNRIVDCCLLAELIKLNVYKDAQWVHIGVVVGTLVSFVKSDGGLSRAHHLFSLFPLSFSASLIHVIVILSTL
jgi:hypothetical protein